MIIRRFAIDLLRYALIVFVGWVVNAIVPAKKDKLRSYIKRRSRNQFTKESKLSVTANHRGVHPMASALPRPCVAGNELELGAQARRSLDISQRPLLKLGCGKCLRCLRVYKLMERYESGSLFQQSSPSTPSTTQPRLLLNFDVNKTILISDQVQNLETDYMLNVLLSECAWGRLGEGPSWIPVGRLATDKPHNDPELMTYRNFLDSFHLPYLEGRGPDVEAENSRRKKARTEFKQSFTDPGQPGAMFVGVKEALKAALAIPEHIKSPMFPTNERKILPSFFELLLHLQRQRRHFTIVFRTFGSDLPDIVEELNAFCTGKHPLYPGVRMDGSDGLTDLRLSMPGSTGVFLRQGGADGDSYLLLGAPEQLVTAKKLELGDMKAAAAEVGQASAGAQNMVQSSTVPPGAEVAQSLSSSALGSEAQGSSSGEAVSSAGAGLLVMGDANDMDGLPDECGEVADLARAGGKRYPKPSPFPTKLLSSLSDIYSVMHNRALCVMNRAYALRDYYPYWKKRNERAIAGKLLLLDPDEQEVLPIFFDDNVGYGAAHIIDVRNAITGEPIPFDQSIGKHLVKVEPLNAILDSKYFIRALSECELAVQEERVRKDLSGHTTSSSGQWLGVGAHPNPDGFETDSPVSSQGLGWADSPKMATLAAQFSQEQPAVGVGIISGKDIGGVFSTKVRRQSYAARVSMVARQRWVDAQGKVIALLRVSSALREQQR